MANKMRGEIPFTAAGEGVILKFTATDLAEIKGRFGDDWFMGAADRCATMDAEYIFFCMEKGSKLEGKPFKPDFDNMDAGMAELADLLLDGIYLSIYRKTFREQMEFIVGELEKQDAAKNAESPSASSPSSETKPIDQG